jgi:hypothetical protein
MTRIGICILLAFLSAARASAQSEVARLAQDHRQQTVRSAVSRAVRLPTRFDTDRRLIDRATGIVTLTGSADFDAETVVADEAGYRVQNLLHARHLELFSNSSPRYALRRGAYVRTTWRF